MDADAKRAASSELTRGFRILEETRLLHPVVAVPARNEAERLPALLRSLSRQTWLRQGRRLTVVVVLNNCTDSSAAVLHDAARCHPSLDLVGVEVTFAAADAHVGSARRLALETAWTRAGCSDAAVLITTDADARPTENWVDANLTAIAHGADLVGGHIIGDPEEEARLGSAFLRLSAKHLQYAVIADRLAAIVDPLPHDPLPRHSDHTGASLAVLGPVYAAVGGMPSLPFREDLAFVSRVRAAGYRLRHAPNVRVQVSARLEGRAPGGMADCLRHWVAEAGAQRPHLVEAPDLIMGRLQRRRAIRDLVTADPVTQTEVLRGLGLPEIAPLSQAEIAALVERLVPDEPDAAETVPVEEAIAAIERIIAMTEGQRLAA